MRRLAFLSIPLCTLALAGCQGFGPAPDVSALPHASITGTHLAFDADRTDSFRVLTIDGHNVQPPVDQPVKTIAIDATNLLPAGRSVHVEFEGFGFYGNTIRRMFWNAMRVEGGVDFVPAPGAQYVVHGSITPTLSTVWIENEGTHEVVGQKATKTHDIPPPADPTTSDTATSPTFK